jgi:hypothetical protein
MAENKKEGEREPLISPVVAEDGGSHQQIVAGLGVNQGRARCVTQEEMFKGLHRNKRQLFRKVGWITGYSGILLRELCNCLKYWKLNADILIVPSHVVMMLGVIGLVGSMGGEGECNPCYPLAELFNHLLGQPKTLLLEQGRVEDEQEPSLATQRWQRRNCYIPMGVVGWAIVAMGHAIRVDEGNSSNSLTLGVLGGVIAVGWVLTVISHVGTVRNWPSEAINTEDAAQQNLGSGQSMI